MNLIIIFVWYVWWLWTCLLISNMSSSLCHPIPEHDMYRSIKIPHSMCPSLCRPQRVRLHLCHHLCHHLWKLRQNVHSQAEQKFLRYRGSLFLFIPFHRSTISCRIWISWSVQPTTDFIWCLALVGVSKAYWRRALESRTSSSLLCQTAGWPPVGIPTSKARLFYWHYSATCDWYLWEDRQKAWTTCL